MDSDRDLVKVALQSCHVGHGVIEYTYTWNNITRSRGKSHRGQQSLVRFDRRHTAKA